MYDFNGDGLPDLAMLDHEGYLAFFERAKRDGKLVLLAPRRAFVDENGKPLRLNAERRGRSGRRKLCVTDWDGDGKFDFLLNSANADLLQQVGQKDGTWVFKNAGTLAKQNIEGHDVSPGVSTSRRTACPTSSAARRTAGSTSCGTSEAGSNTVPPAREVRI